jgi:nucleoside-diphosphate-sugar epimerase
MHVLGLFKAIKKGIFPLINNGKSTLHPTYIDDLIAGFELCMTHDNAVGNVYFIAGERKVSVKELSESMAEVMNVAVPKIYVSEWLIRIGAHILEPMCKYMNIEPPVTHAKINFFTQSRGVSIQKANKELGYVPQTGLKQGLIKTVTWYKDNGYL